MAHPVNTVAHTNLTPSFPADDCCAHKGESRESGFMGMAGESLSVHGGTRQKAQAFPNEM